MNGLNLQLDAAILTPLIQRVVAETIAQIDATKFADADKLAYSEQEAARMLGLESHQLRDERLRGRIHASQIVGRRIRYTKQDLMSYLAEREWRQG